MFNCILIIIITFIFSASQAFAQTNNELFEKMVGPEVRMDSAITAQVLQGDPETQIAVDSDHDGRIDCIYMIDTDDRHKAGRSPLLVKIVDEDGDMYLTNSGDLDSDLYVADWYGDGSIDRVIDYIDLDNDGDLDEQVLYQWTDMRHFLAQSPRNFDGRAYCAVWAKDYGDDNRLWYDINYEYSQSSTQWLTDFNGDEIFVYAFFYDYDRNRLLPGFENPFSFYDLDGDFYSEEVVRFGGANLSARTLRYSMDIDNDTRGSNHHDYDFSISAVGPISYPLEKCMTLSLRGIETGHVLKWEHVRQVAKAGAWGKAHLTWDENDNNVDPVEGRQHHERWEGIISHGNEYIQRVGGPSCGPYNKRNEVDTDGSGGFRFYYSPVDRRLHLFGAEVGWISVDYDYDNRVDMIVRMDDGDRDGFFDTWKYDIDADSTFDREYNTTGDTATLHAFDYYTLHEVYMPSLKKALDDNQKVIDTLKAVLKRYEANFSPDPVEEYFCTALADYGKEFHLGEKIRNSPEGTRYYGDILRERYWHRLVGTRAATERIYPEVKQAYERGDYHVAANLLEEHMLDEPVMNWYGSFAKRFIIEIDNPKDVYLEHHPIVLSIGDITKAVPDFNSRNYVLVEHESRIDPRIISSQSDDVDVDAKPDELVFVHSLAPLSKTKLFCYYSPTGKSDITYRSKTDTHRDWLKSKVNIGWESNWCGYRMYYGQIDFFGKRMEGLRLKNPGQSYHLVSDWGMDVLHAGRSSGLGGISIWEGGRRIPVMNPAGEGEVTIERTILSSGPVRSLVRVDFGNIRSDNGEYTVTMLMSAFADNRFSRQDITITTALGDSVVFSPGIMRLANDTWRLDTATGALASWGLSDREIREIGLGLMFDPGEFNGYAESDLDRYVKLAIPAGKRYTYWIIGGWRKGYVSPVAPSAQDWSNEVEELGLRLRTPLRIRCYEE